MGGELRVEVYIRPLVPYVNLLVEGRTGCPIPRVATLNCMAGGLKGPKRGKGPQKEESRGRRVATRSCMLSLKIAAANRLDHSRANKLVAFIPQSPANCSHEQAKLH